VPNANAETLSPAQTQEALRCSLGYPENLNGFRYWLAKYAVIEDQAKGGAGKFQIWPAHIEAIDALEANKYLIVLKARQIGMSWLFGAAYPLWLANFHSQKLILLFSQSDDDAAELIRKARYMWAQLPDHLRTPLEKDNQFTLEFKNGSRILARSSNPNAGSGYTASYVFADEHAKQPYAGDQYAATKPTVDSTPGARFVANSTAYGTGNFFHELWLGAVKGENGFTPLFFSWKVRPDRDQAWYEAQQISYDPVKLAREYPEDADQAFLTSVPRRFNYEVVKANFAPADPLAGAADHPELGTLLELRRGPRGLGFVLYEPPTEGRQYVIGVDTAEGLTATLGDAQVAVVLDRENGQEVAVLHGRWPLPQFTDYLHELATAYRAQPMGVERNNHGHYVNLTLEQRRIDAIKAGKGVRYQLYYEKPLLSPQGKVLRAGKAGWNTDARSKPILFDALEEALMGERLVLHTPALLEELKLLAVDEDGKVGAPSKAHDDLAVALAIAWMVLVQTPAARDRPQVPFRMGQPAPAGRAARAPAARKPFAGPRRVLGGPTAPGGTILQRLHRQPIRTGK
jgi:hypothetical protein